MSTHEYKCIWFYATLLVSDASGVLAFVVSLLCPFGLYYLVSSPRCTRSSCVCCVIVVSASF
uniref:Uncharacterized protein LOC101311440 n=1 Tax=Rhizophora mucronata TaxID=61149 RepID=A0A2P2KWQ3_RHIMU